MGWGAVIGLWPGLAGTDSAGPALRATGLGPRASGLGPRPIDPTAGEINSA
jgi:hypothetical protein